MLRALRQLIGLGGPGPQLSFELEEPPRDAKEMRERLVRHGLDPRYRLRLTSNRTVFVSYSSDEVRVQQGFLRAGDNVMRAIVQFVQTRSRADRNRARRVLLSFPIDRESSARSRRRAPEKTHPDDEAMAGRLRRAHEAFNRDKFGGILGTPPIRVSRRMKSRLGHYTHRTPSGDGGEIAISRKHIKRHGWTEAMDTLVHEMVHQWQDETGQAVDHGREFRQKARDVAISPHARKDVA
ncbi:MAG TPA: SprT-like domain-containing protein [Gemmatimonadaceae bacterium]